MFDRQRKITFRVAISAAFLFTALHAVSPTFASDEPLNPAGVNDILPLMGTEGQMILGFGQPLSAAFSNEPGRFITFSVLGFIDWTLENDVPQPVRYVLREGSYFVREMQYVPGKNWIVAFASHSLSVYDLDAREELYRITDFSPRDEFSISPDGSTLVYFNEESNRIVFWDIEEGKSIHAIERDYNALPTFTRDNKRVYLLANTNPDKATNDADLLQIYNLETESIESEFLFTDSGISLGDITISSMGYLTYETHEYPKHTVHVVDINRQQEILSIPYTDTSPLVVAFSPDGTHLVMGTRGYSFVFSGQENYTEGVPPKLYNLETGEVSDFANNVDTGVSSVVFSPDGRYFITNDCDSILRIWSVADRRCMGVLPGFCEDFSQATFSPDGRYVLSCSGNPVADDRTAKRWELERGENINIYQGHNTYVASVAYSPDGETVAAGAQDGSVKIWNASTGEEILTLEAFQKAINAIQYSLDGKTLATGSDDGSVVLWDAASGAKETTLRLERGGVNCVAFSPDGRYLAAGNKDLTRAGLGTLVVWNIETGEAIRKFSYNSRDQVLSVAFSKDGQSILAGLSGPDAVIWNVETGERSQLYNQHGDGVFDVSFSPKGDYISTGSGDDRARIYSLDSQEAILSVDQSGTGIVSKISPDGSKWLVNNTIWDIDLATPVGQWMMY